MNTCNDECETPEKMLVWKGIGYGEKSFVMIILLENPNEGDTKDFSANTEMRAARKKTREMKVN